MQTQLNTPVFAPVHVRPKVAAILAAAAAATGFVALIETDDDVGVRSVTPVQSVEAAGAIDLRPDAGLTPHSERKALPSSHIVQAQPYSGMRP